MEVEEAQVKKTLWRAAADDYIPDAASFAAHREDAEAYFDDPGYGGSLLWRARVNVTEDEVLNLYDERDPVTLLAEKYDLSHPGAIGVEEWIPRDPELQEAIHEEGFDWVVVRDSFPEGAETWLWLGAFDDAPELEEAVK
jgi:hypothetical protein